MEPEAVELPSWVGVEITGDHRYYNAWLSQHPYSSWDDDSPEAPGGVNPSEEIRS